MKPADRILSMGLYFPCAVKELLYCYLGVACTRMIFSFQDKNWEKFLESR
jgi:hypothetical protein